MRNYKKKYTKTKTTTVSKAVKKYVKKTIAVQQEHKVFDASITQLGQDYTGAIYNLSTPSQGDGYNQYNGIVISCKSLEMRGAWEAGDTYNTMRVIVFKWHNDGAIDIPSPNEILQFVAALNAPYEPYNYVHRQEFTVLKDYMSTCDLLGGQAARKFHFKINLHNSKLRFTDTTNGRGVNGIYVLCISDSSGGVNPDLSFISRLTFTDS